MNVLIVLIQEVNKNSSFGNKIWLLIQAPSHPPKYDFEETIVTHF